ncbi:MAG: hypothetical protein LBJ22_03525, partial [Synergistaceae bacterium]|nr:hypothetical protein [Synergistaceae bacterium]
MSETIALLSNVTAESLALRIEKEDPRLTVFTPPGFDTWRTELLNPSPEFRRHIKTIYVILHGPALFPDGADVRFTEVLSEPLNILSQTQAEYKDK